MLGLPTVIDDNVMVDVEYRWSQSRKSQVATQAIEGKDMAGKDIMAEQIRVLWRDK